MTNPQDRSISPEQARQWLSSGEAILIDVRSPDEFKAEHIAQACSVPLAQIGELGSHIDIPATRRIIFQCLRGKRGNQACTIIRGDIPQDRTYNMTGGIEAWKEAGLPVVNSGTGAISIFRQVQIVLGSLVFLAVLAGLQGYTAGFAIAAFLGAALAVSGITGWCGLAMLLSHARWNRPAAGKPVQ